MKKINYRYFFLLALLPEKKFVLELEGSASALVNKTKKLLVLSPNSIIICSGELICESEVPTLTDFITANNWLYEKGSCCHDVVYSYDQQERLFSAEDVAAPDPIAADIGCFNLNTGKRHECTHQYFWDKYPHLVKI